MPIVITPTLGKGPAGLVAKMAKGLDLGAEGAAWPEVPGEGVTTYSALLRALMTPAGYTLIQEDAVWGGPGTDERWSKAIIRTAGYKSAADAVVARGSKAKHAFAGLREALTKAKLQNAWRKGAWRGDGEEEADEEEGGREVPVTPVIPAHVASWLKATGHVATPVRGTAPAANRAGARANGRRGTQGELPRNRMSQLEPRVEDLSVDPAWCSFVPGTLWDQFVLDYGRSAFLDARSKHAGGITSEQLVCLLARDDTGYAPGYSTAEKVTNPAQVYVLHDYASRVVRSGAKNALSANHVAETAERYFWAFSALLGASAVEGARDPDGPVRRLAKLKDTVTELAAAVAGAMHSWKAADATPARWVLESTRARLLRVAADLYSSKTLTQHLETVELMKALVPQAVEALADAHTTQRAREDKKRASTPADEPPGKRPKAGVCRFGAECKRHKQFVKSLL
jgi:hypothetical protein